MKCGKNREKCGTSPGRGQEEVGKWVGGKVDEVERGDKGISAAIALGLQGCI
jgi:hypothetical protein